MGGVIEVCGGLKADMDDRAITSFLWNIHNTGDELVIGLPNPFVTIGLVRLNSGAGLVGVLTEILGIPGGVITDSTAR